MSETKTSPSGIRTETSKGLVTFDEFRINEYQKPGTKTVQLRQIVTTKSFYPSKKVANSLQENLFSTEEFGFDESEYTNEETRMAWLLVPENVTQEQILAKLEAANKNGACIYKVMAGVPILSEDQEYAIEQGLRTKDQFANTQVLRYPENEKTIADGTANTLILDGAGNPIYRRTYFWNSPKEDMDGRENGKSYITPELKAELEGAATMKGQTL